MRDCKLIATLEVNNRLGEGIVWHADSQSVWWTDIHSCCLYRCSWPQQTLQQWNTPERLTAFAIVNLHPLKLLVSFASGFAFYWPDEQQVQWIQRPERALAGNRFNDGRVDRQGRFWAGTMAEDAQGQQGTLYRLDGNGCIPVLSGLSIPNALCWSPDSKVMYHADTPTGKIVQYDFEPTSGAVTNQRDFAAMPVGEPDGAITDANGDLWVALWGGSGVARFSPDGYLQGLLELPVSQPTCVAFGGPDMNLLFMTSATEGLSRQQRDAEPLAGAVFVYQTPFQGLEEPGVVL